MNNKLKIAKTAFKSGPDRYNIISSDNAPIMLFFSFKFTPKGKNMIRPGFNPM